MCTKYSRKYSIFKEIYVQTVVIVHLVRYHNSTNVGTICISIKSSFLSKADWTAYDIQSGNQHRTSGDYLMAGGGCQGLPPGAHGLPPGAHTMSAVPQLECG